MHKQNFEKPPGKVRDTILKEFGWNWRHIKELMVEDSLWVLVATLFVITVAIFYSCFSIYGPGLLLTEEQYVIKSCNLYVSRVARQRAAGNTTLATGHPFAKGNSWDKALTKYYGPIVSQSVLRGLSVGIESACYDIKRDCNGNSEKGLCPEIYKLISW